MDLELESRACVHLLTGYPAADLRERVRRRVSFCENTEHFRRASTPPLHAPPLPLQPPWLGCPRTPAPSLCTHHSLQSDVRTKEVRESDWTAHSVTVFLASISRGTHEGETKRPCHTTSYSTATPCPPPRRVERRPTIRSTFAGFILKDRLRRATISSGVSRTTCPRHGC